MLDLNEINNREFLCIFIRHAEKNIYNYNLSDKGRADSLEFAEMLLQLNKPICVFSSPEERCIETATIINRRINGKKHEIHISDILGKPGIQVKDKNEYKKLTDTMRCRDIFYKWKMDDYYRAMHSKEIIKEKILNFLKDTSLKDGVTLYISQSGTVACTGYSLNLIDYTEISSEWVNYLDGYIITDLF